MSAARFFWGKYSRGSPHLGILVDHDRIYFFKISSWISKGRLASEMSFNYTRTLAGRLHQLYRWKRPKCSQSLCYSKFILKFRNPFNLGQYSRNFDVINFWEGCRSGNTYSENRISCVNVGKCLFGLGVGFKLLFCLRFLRGRLLHILYLRIVLRAGMLLRWFDERGNRVLPFGMWIESGRISLS